MIVGYVEPSGEVPELARAEVASALRAVGGVCSEGTPGPSPALLVVSVAHERELARLADRLALSRRVLVACRPRGSIDESAQEEGRSGLPASVRRLGSPSGPADESIRAAGAAYRQGGGRIELDRPARRYWLARDAQGREVLLREVGAVDRSSFTARAMPRLPFRRPVSLAPRLARAAVNLSGVREGEPVLDPFLGTGALLAEAALLGARVYGIDRDPTMVRGALENFRHLSVGAEAFAQGDAREVGVGPEGLRFRAIVTDAPYGRSSAAGGVEPGELVRAVLRRWSERVLPDGVVVAVVPGGPPLLGPPWKEELRIPVRVHRSLTREFRRYVRAG